MIPKQITNVVKNGQTYVRSKLGLWKTDKSTKQTLTFKQNYTNQMNQII